VRRFRPDPIPDDALRRGLGAGIRASSSYLAPIYTAVKDTRAAHEVFARNVLGYLEAQGFLPPR
jgi:hypothetical protein